MKKTLLLLLFTATSVCAQQLQITNLRDALTLKNDLSNKYNAYNPDIKGTPFIHNKLEKILLQGNAMKGKYNANQDYIELERDGKIVFFLPAIEYPFEVKFVDQNSTYKAFEIEATKYGFFKILAAKEKAFLLCKEYVKLNAEVKPKSNFEIYKPAKFTREKDTYFIKFKNQEIVIELPTKKSKFYKVFKGKENAIKTYIKKQRLNIKKSKDLIQIFNYYNTL